MQLPGVAQHLAVEPVPGESGAATVSWDVVPSATSYLVELDSGDGFAAVYFGPSTSTQVHGVHAGMTHLVRVRAENVVGSGQWTVPVDVS